MIRYRPLVGPLCAPADWRKRTAMAKLRCRNVSFMLCPFHSHPTDPPLAQANTVKTHIREAINLKYATCNFYKLYFTLFGRFCNSFWEKKLGLRLRVGTAAVQKL